MKKLTTFLLSILSVCAFAQQTIDLSGKWQFAIDREQQGVAQQWFNRVSLDDEILLPGSMTEQLKGDLPSVHTVWTGSLYDSTYFFNPAMARYREPGENFALPFFLTPPRDYKGYAWYCREVAVPADWAGQEVLLTLERPHIKTTVWVNGQEMGSQESLCIPHRFDVSSAIKPGENNHIAVLVSNDMKDCCVGQDSHSVSDQTQGNWNGITGEMSLEAVSPIHFSDNGWLAPVEVYPNVKQQRARVCVHFNNQEKKNVTVICRIEGEVQILRTTADTASFDFSGLNRLWDEFTPNLYTVETQLLQPEQKKGRKTIAPEKVLDRRSTVFGMREIECRGRDIYVNGRQVLLRGTVENADFPLTGYVPTDTASWMRVFRICKEWGLNHMRFHSYCPPEAAFVAADIVGFYLQPEGPSWPNHGVKMNRGEKIDTYLLEETQRLTREYGNHPSYCMLSAGNEPAGGWVPWATRFVEYWKKADQRRIYTGFTVGGGWDWQPANQFHAKAGNRGLNDWDKQMPGTRSDFSRASFKGGYKFEELEVPFLCHEMGQWCAFPDLDEPSQYTGVLKAKNFEIFRQTLADNDMAERAKPFLMASGKLQALCYKYEIEKLRRTPHYAGYQLLSLNDYSGQGTALVGVLNVFFTNKGYIEAPEWCEYNAPTVITMQTDRFVWRDNEKILFDLATSDYGNRDLSAAKLTYEWQGADQPAPRKQTLRATLRLGNEVVATNHWDFWVYPAEVKSAPGKKIYVCDSLDEKAKKILRKGGDVLLTAGNRVTYGRDIKQYFTPVFWNTSWFKMRPPHTTGILVEEEHPIFECFPTDYHSDLQWWELVNRTPVMLFTDFPKGFQPQVQSIDTWFLSRKCGMLFEARVGKGRLIMTTFDLSSQLDQRIVARQLRASILNYMQSDKFNPAFKVPVENIQDLFTKVAPAFNSYVNESPDELKPGFEKPKK